MLTKRLGPTNPCLIAIYTETLPTSVFEARKAAVPEGLQPYYSIENVATISEIRSRGSSGVSYPDNSFVATSISPYIHVPTLSALDVENGIRQKPFVPSIFEAIGFDG